MAELIEGMTHGENGFNIGMKGFGRAEKMGLVGRFEFNKGSVISLIKCQTAAAMTCPLRWPVLNEPSS